MSKQRPLSLLVKKLDNHVALDQEDRQAVLALPYTERRLPPLSYIMREGEVLDRCAVLLAGFAFRQKLVPEGSRQIVSIQIPGDPVDLQHLFLDQADHSVVAMTDVELAMIPRPALRQIAMERPKVAQAFAVSNQVEGSIFREWLLNIGRRDARRRVAHLLCEVATRLEGQDLADGYGYELPMSQELLGDATGLTSIHVNRTLRALEKEGLITRVRRNVRIPNWSALKNVAGFDPLYLHIGQQAAVSATA